MRTLDRSMPAGFRASLTRMEIVVPRVHASTPGGEGLPVAGVVLTTYGAPDAGSR
jgi:hypothetical protein